MMRCTRHARVRPGFTLIEMALVIVALGIIISLVGPPVFTMIKRGKVAQGKDMLNTVKNQIVGYAMINNNQLPPNLAAAGDTTDPWGRAFEYIPADGAPDLTSEDICDTSVTETDLDLTTDAGTIQNVGFIVASRAHKVNGNFDFDYTADPVDISGPGKVDDLVQFMTLNQLKAKLCLIKDGQFPWLKKDGWPDPADIFGTNPGSDYEGITVESASGTEKLEEANQADINGMGQGTPWVTLRRHTTNNDILMKVSYVGGGEANIWEDEYEPEDDRYYRFSFSYNTNGTDEVLWNVKRYTSYPDEAFDQVFHPDMDGDVDNPFTLNSPPAGYDRYIGNFYILSKIPDTGNDASMHITNITVNGVKQNPPNDEMINDHTGGSGNSYIHLLSQREEATESIEIEGDVYWEWFGSQSSEYSMSIYFYIHDVESPN